MCQTSIRQIACKGLVEKEQLKGFLAYHSPHESNGPKGQTLAIVSKKQL